jgi:hypothetical protein
MARIGSFSRGTVDYGIPLSFVKPPDNNPGSKFSDELNDPSLKLTEKEKEELQQRIDELEAALRGERDYLLNQ